MKVPVSLLYLSKINIFVNTTLTESCSMYVIFKCFDMYQYPLLQLTFHYQSSSAILNRSKKKYQESLNPIQLVSMFNTHPLP